MARLESLPFLVDAVSHAFLWRNGQMQDLGTLSNETYSYGYGIDDAGQVVGISNSSNDETAFLWQNGAMLDLNALVINKDPGWQLISASAISSSGMIAVDSNDAVLGSIGLMAVHS